jgi:hypothetical protein
LGSIDLIANVACFRRFFTSAAKSANIRGMSAWHWLTIASLFLSSASFAGRYPESARWLKPTEVLSPLDREVFEITSRTRTEASYFAVLDSEGQTISHTFVSSNDPKSVRGDWMQKGLKHALAIAWSRGMTARIAKIIEIHTHPWSRSDFFFGHNIGKIYSPNDVSRFIYQKALLENLGLNQVELEAGIIYSTRQKQARRQVVVIPANASHKNGDYRDPIRDRRSPSEQTEAVEHYWQEVRDLGESLREGRCTEASLLQETVAPAVLQVKQSLGDSH